VKYGRMLLFAFESTESMEDLKAAIDFACKPSKVDTKAEAAYLRTLSKTKINLLILGGPTAMAERVVTGGVQEIQQYIHSGDRYDENTAAVPLSYTLYFLKDYALGNICLTTTYVERHCVKATGRVRVKNLRLRCERESDPGAEIELYGSVWVRGGVDGGGTVTATRPDRIWTRDKAHYLDLREGQEMPINDEPVFTFVDLPKVQERAFVEVSASLMEYDDTSADDRLTGEPKRVYMRDIVPLSGPRPRHEAVFAGDGNIVKILFDVELLQ
jgi:hypothetical protein